MLTVFLKHPRVSKIITSFVLVNFILNGISFRNYTWANADKLRPNAAAKLKVAKNPVVTDSSEGMKKISTAGEIKWEMLKQSPKTLYFNNNLALTGIEVRNSFLSTGHPTVEVGFNLISRGGREIKITGEAASGASAGNREALFLFDKDFAKKAEKQPDMLTDAMIVDIYGKGVDKKEALRRLKSNYEGKGVEITLWIARNVLIPELTKAIKEGKVDPKERYSVDRFMREYEKTHGGNERQKLILTGGNTTAFSTAAAKLGAAFNNMQTWEFLSYRPDPKSLKIDYNSFGVVIPIAVLIEGGEHGNWNTDFQEYMVEVKGKDFEEISLKLINITFALDKIMQKRGDKIGVGLEAGYLPNVMSNTEPIEMIVQAGKDAGYVPGEDYAIALDVASSEFRKEYQGERYYFYSVEGKRSEQVILSGGKRIGKIVEIQEDGQEKKKFLLLTSQEQLEWALDICKNPKYFIASVEDFFDQDDLWGNMMLTRTLQDKNFIASLPHEFQRKDGIRQDAISHVGDDISTSNMEVVRAGIDGGKVIFEGKEGKEELVLEKDTIDAVLLKLNQAGTVQEIMELVEYLRGRGRTIAHSHRGKEPSKETIRADVALASTTYPSREHDRTGAPAKVKIKYGSIRKERAVVYDYLRNAYAQIEKKIEESKVKEATFASSVSFDINAIISQLPQKLNIPQEKVADFNTKVSAYVNTEKASFVIRGGKQLSDYIGKIKEMQETVEAEKPKLSISAEKVADNGSTFVELTIKWGDDIIEKSNLFVGFSTDELKNQENINSALNIVNRIQEVNSLVQERKWLDLRVDKDFQEVKEIVKEVFGNYVPNFIEPCLVKVKNRLVELKPGPYAIIVDAADYFITPGAASTLLEALRLAGENFKIGIFGAGTANLKILLGGGNNIIIADSQVELGRKLVEDLGIKASNIKLVRAGNTPTITMAVTLHALYNITNETEKAFNDFYTALTEAKVISSQEYERTKGPVYKAIAATKLDESGRILAVELPEIKLESTVAETDAEIIADFMTAISG